MTQLWWCAMALKIATTMVCVTCPICVDVHQDSEEWIAQSSSCVPTTALRKVFVEHTHASAIMDSLDLIVRQNSSVPTTATEMESATVVTAFVIQASMARIVLARLDVRTSAFMESAPSKSVCARKATMVQTAATLTTVSPAAPTTVHARIVVVSAISDTLALFARP